MNMNMLLFWSFALTVCAFALFVHSLLLMSKPIQSQHLSWWKMLVVILTCLVSIWSMFVAFDGFSTVLYFSNSLSWHYFPPNFYNMLVANVNMAIVSCQIQAAIVVAVLIIGTFLGRKLFPTVKTVPQWVTIRENRPLL